MVSSFSPTQLHPSSTIHELSDDLAISTLGLQANDRMSGYNNANKHPKFTKNKLTFATLNMWGGGSQSTEYKWNNLWQMMRNSKIAVLAVQETHLTPCVTQYLEENFSSRMIILNNCPDRNVNSSQGIALLINKHIVKWKEISSTVIIPGQASLLSIPWCNPDTLNILAVYAPNVHSHNSDFWRKLSNTDTPPIHILLGDFNMVEESIDHLPCHNDPNNIRESLTNLKGKYGLIDGWRCINPHSLQFTFQNESSSAHSRIDRIYIADNLLANTSNWRLDCPPITTDHYMVSMQLANLHAPYVGHGRWTIPLFLLQDAEFLHRIKTLGDELMTSIHNDNSHTQQYHFLTFKKEITRIARGFAK